MSAPASPPLPSGPPVLVPPASALVTARLAELAAATVRSDAVVIELPSPSRLAPFTRAMSIEIGETAVAKVVWLHDPAGQPGWQGTERLVAHLRSGIDPEFAADPLLSAVVWSYLEECLSDRGATARAAGGTVTVTSDARFGLLAGLPTGHHVALRCSWTPDAGALGPHLAAVADILAALAGLPPEGVAPLHRPRPA